MIHKDIIAKYSGGGFPTGPIDISNIKENANNIVERGDMDLMIVANASLGNIHARGYFPPYLNHRKMALFCMDSCIDTNERVF